MSGPVRCDLLLRGGTVVTVDAERRILSPGDVAIAGDRIAAVEPDASRIEAARTIDCAGQLVLPGLVDCHNHLFQTLGRGLGEGLDGWRWLASFMWPYAGAITHDETVAAVRLGAVEAVRAGTTAVLDHHYGRTDAETTLAVADAVEAVGLRGAVARGIAGPLSELGRREGLPETGFRYDADEELALTRACMDARPAGGRVEVWPGPVNAVYTERDLLAAAVELARERGTGWHTHFCAPARDPDIYAAAYGSRPAPWLHEQGLLGPRTTLAHATWLDDRDVELLGASRTCVAHCPLSNQYMPYGVMRLRDLRDAGATVGLGTDGSACGHRQDLFEQMKGTILLQRIHTLAPDASSAAEALELATRDGARVLGIDAGALEPGRLADVIVVDATRPGLAPLNAPVPSLAYAARGSDVRLTIVGGEVVYADGRCLRVDEAAIVADAARRARELTRRLDSLATRQ